MTLDIVDSKCYRISCTFEIPDEMFLLRVWKESYIQTMLAKKRLQIKWNFT